MQGLHQGHCVKYTGGKDFPLLLWLDLFAKKFGHSLMAGQEMMQQLTWFNFKALSPLPFCRLALLATILTSRKHSDGISRLVTKSDLDKMKGSLQENAIKMEDLLHAAWNKLQMDTSLSTDTKTLLFESFTQILQVFAQELLQLPRQGPMTQPVWLPASHKRFVRCKT